MSNSFTNQTIAQIDIRENSDRAVGVYRLDKHLDEEVARLHLRQTWCKAHRLIKGKPTTSEFLWMGHTSLSTTVISPQLCRISIIAACSRNRVIGRDGRLPWDIPEDWGYFLDQTSSGTLLLGRRCYEEMRERHLKESSSYCFES